MAKLFLVLDVDIDPTLEDPEVVAEDIVWCYNSLNEEPLKVESATWE